MGVVQLRKEDLEVYVGKWFTKDDPETDELRKLLSNGKKVLSWNYLLKNDLVRAKLRQLGMEIVYKRKKIGEGQKMYWTLKIV